MRRLGPARYALVAATVALATALPLVAGTARFGPVALRFALAGWALMALAAIAGGAWLVARHGLTGSAFFVALASCMLARLILAAVGAGIAAMRGTEAVFAYAVGLVAGYVPLQVFEMVWFQRRTASGRPNARVTSR
jgi:hypothetical protein